MRNPRLPLNRTPAPVSRLAPTRARARDLVRRAKPPSRQERLMPFLYAGGLFAIGAALIAAKPRIGHVPAPVKRGTLPTTSRLKRAARQGRDGAAAFAPDNVTDSIGRSLVLGGVALLLTRLFDEASGR